MTKQEILDRINEIIEEEKGKAVPIDGKFIDSELDSLGISIALMTIDSEFPIIDDEVEDELEALDIENLTMRDLVHQCKLSITNTSTEANSNQDT